jgi:hypothetical protein
MAETQEASGEDDLDPDLIEDNAGENEPPAEPPAAKGKARRVPDVRGRRTGLDGHLCGYGHPADGLFRPDSILCQR